MWQPDQRKDRSSWSRQAVEHGGRTARAYEEAHDLSVQTACSVLSTEFTEAAVLRVNWDMLS